ncbi:MAG: hypothetical protein GY870_19180 [archaeon]|nr:hypothetical protein [archaeon]
MDAPLVLSVTLDPNEVDGEAHNVDGLAKYPLEFYERIQNYIKPGEIEKSMGLLKTRLGKPEQFEGIKFNLPTVNINFGPKISSYKTMETMDEKIESQLQLGEQIEAVNATDVARKVLQSHFTPDIMGNLRSYSTQGFRCVCGTKYRRMPLSGKCNNCGKELIKTVSKGGIIKYLPKALNLCDRYDLGHYTHQRFELIDEYVKSLTDNPKVKQVKITSFFK